MALNLEKLRKRKEALENRSSRNDDKVSVWLKLKPGLQFLRLLPPMDDSGDAFKEYFSHYLKAGNKFWSFLCPKRNNPVSDRDWETIVKIAILV